MVGGIDPWPPDRGRRRPGTTSLDCRAGRGRSEKTLLSLVSEDPGWANLDRFALTQGLTGPGSGWPKWQLLELPVVAALARYHQRASDNPGLEQDRLRHALDVRLPVPAFDAVITVVVRDGALPHEGPWLSCRVTRPV
jgi:hypothetical protein